MSERVSNEEDVRGGPYIVIVYEMIVVGVRGGWRWGGVTCRACPKGSCKGQLRRSASEINTSLSVVTAAVVVVVAVVAVAATATTDVAASDIAATRPSL